MISFSCLLSCCLCRVLPLLPLLQLPISPPQSARPIIGQQQEQQLWRTWKSRRFIENVWPLRNHRKDVGAEVKQRRSSRSNPTFSQIKSETYRSPDQIQWAAMAAGAAAGKDIYSRCRRKNRGRCRSFHLRQQLQQTCTQPRSVPGRICGKCNDKKARGRCTKYRW